MRVNDGTGGADTQTFNINVTEPGCDISKEEMDSKFSVSFMATNPGDLSNIFPSNWEWEWICENGIYYTNTEPVMVWFNSEDYIGNITSHAPRPSQYHFSGASYSSTGPAELIPTSVTVGNTESQWFRRYYSNQPESTYTFSSPSAPELGSVEITLPPASGLVLQARDGEAELEGADNLSPPVVSRPVAWEFNPSHVEGLRETDKAEVLRTFDGGATYEVADTVTVSEPSFSCTGLCRHEASYTPTDEDVGAQLTLSPISLTGYRFSAPLHLEDADGYYPRMSGVVLTRFETLETAYLEQGHTYTDANQGLLFKGGSGEYRITVIDGSAAPAATSIPGMTVDADGYLVGTPTTAGTYTVNVSGRDRNVYDSTYMSQSNQAVEIQVIGGAAPGAGETLLIGQTYEGPTAISLGSGGSGSFQASVTSGDVPSGMTIVDAVLTGSPDTAGTYTFDFELHDTGTNSSSTGTATFIVDDALSVTDLDLELETTIEYTQSDDLQLIFGGSGNHDVSVNSGTIAGMSVTGSGLLTGTPTTAGSYTLNITATDLTEGGSVTGDVTVTIAQIVLPKLVLKLPPPSLRPDTIVMATENRQSVSYMLQAYDAVEPVTFSLASGSLPVGTSLDSATGELFSHVSFGDWGNLPSTSSGTTDYPVQIEVAGADGKSETFDFNIGICKNTVPGIDECKVSLQDLDALNSSGGEHYVLSTTYLTGWGPTLATHDTQANSVLTAPFTARVFRNGSECTAFNGGTRFCHGTQSRGAIDVNLSTGDITVNGEQLLSGSNTTDFEIILEDSQGRLGRTSFSRTTHRSDPDACSLWC